MYIDMLTNYCKSTTFNPLTAKDAIWRPEVITQTAIGLTFADKYFYVSQHSMRVF